MSHIRGRLPLLLLAAVMIGVAALLLRVTRGGSLFADEWFFFAYRSHGSAVTLFAPNNGSLDLVTILLYRAVFRLFGPDTTVLRAILVALELACASLFFQLARRRVGEWIALGGATLLLLLGSGWLLVSTVGITLYLAVGFGLAALIAIERGSLRADALACALLVVAIASYSAALPFVAGAVVAIALRPPRLRWRRAWVIVVPLLCYGAWRLWADHYAQHPKLPFVTGAMIDPGAIPIAPARIAEALAAGLASATGLFRVGAHMILFDNYVWAVPLAVLFVVAALARFRWRRRLPLDRGVWVFLAMPLVYWIAISLVAQREPGSTHWSARAPNNVGYQYTSVLLLLLAAAALVTGVRISRLARLALGAVLLVSLVANVLALHEAATYFRSYGPIDRAELAAVELVGSRAARVSSFTSVSVPLPPRDYLSAAAKLGSAAASVSSLPRMTPEARSAGDRTLISLFALAPRPSAPIAPGAARARAPGLESGAAELEQPERGCVSVHPRIAGTPLSFRLPRGGFTVQVATGGPVTLYLRRFADAPGLSIGSVGGGVGAIVAIPADTSAQPWRLLISPVQSVRLCARPNAAAPPARRSL